MSIHPMYYSLSVRARAELDSLRLQIEEEKAKTEAFLRKNPHLLTLLTNHAFVSGQPISSILDVLDAHLKQKIEQQEAELAQLLNETPGLSASPTSEGSPSPQSILPILQQQACSSASTTQSTSSSSGPATSSLSASPPPPPPLSTSRSANFQTPVPVRMAPMPKAKVSNSAPVPSGTPMEVDSSGSSL